MSSASFTPAVSPDANSAFSTCDANCKSSSSSDQLGAETWHRSLSSNELAYFLPSRATGVNDMYLHHHLSTRKPHLLSRARVELVWAIMRARHPLLASRVSRGPSGEVDDWLFSYTVPSNVEDALHEASQSFHSFSDVSGSDIISTYLNGPRQLSNSLLSKIIISFHALPSSDATSFDFLLASTHFIGDGMAIHLLANQFWTLVGSESEGIDELRETLRKELSLRLRSNLNLLPLSAESRLSPPPRWNPNFFRAVSRLAYESGKRKSIGAQILPRRSRAVPSPVNTVVPTRYWSSGETRQALKTCRANKISFAHAVFALVNLAWLRMGEKRIVLYDAREPMMMYSALCMRSCLNRLPSTDIDSPIRPSFVHLSLSYFNIVLPSFPLSPWTCASETFFLRARQTKAQILRETKSPLLVGKALAEMQDRRQRAVAWARKDNEVEERRKHELERSTSEEMKPGSNVRSTGTTPPTTIISHKAPPAITDVPLLGLSILGNLDAFYNHESFGPISLESLTNGCRQRAGASLLFGYIFRGQMTLSLGYDQPAFAPGVMEALWMELGQGVKEMLLPPALCADGSLRSFL